MIQKRLLSYCVAVLIIWGLASSLQAQNSKGRGPISIFANVGGGGLSGKPEITLSNTGKIYNAVTEKNIEIQITSLKFGLGISYAHPVNDLLGIGVLAEFRLLMNFSNGLFDLTRVNLFKTFSVGFGFSLGPYFRLGLWGSDKRGGLGLAPYFTINLLRLLTEQYKDKLYSEEPLIGIGGGLLVAIFFTRRFGINLGLELQSATYKGKYEDYLAFYSKNNVDLLGAIFYVGVTLSF